MRTVGWMKTNGPACRFRHKTRWSFSGYTLRRESHTTGQQHQSGVRSAFLHLQKKKKKNSQMPRHLISDAHEWINEIPSVPIYLAQLVRATEE